jgi:hypothetical protein
MGKFQDSYTPSEGGGGGIYIGAEEKAVLAEGGIPFKVTDVIFDPDTQYGEQYELIVFLPSDPEEERKLAFSAKSNVGSRDDMLEQASEFFGGDDAEPFWLKLTKVGRAWIPVLADEPGAEKPKARPRTRKS